MRPGGAAPIDLANLYPAVDDVKRRALARLPGAIRGFLETGTGEETCLAANRRAFAECRLTPRTIGGGRPELATGLFGELYSLPFGIAPMGMADLVWPGSDVILGATARRRGIPYVLSVLASLDVEEGGRDLDGRGWLQVYPTRDPAILDDLVGRAARAGYGVLVVTVDSAVLGRRESMRRAGFTMPVPRLNTFRFLSSCLLHPVWPLRMRRLGMRFCPSFAPYAGGMDRQAIAEALRAQLPAALDWDGLQRLRDKWRGTLVVKGVLDPDEALRVMALGADGIWVSNHGGRQLDAAPATLYALAAIRAAVGPGVTLLVDSGVRSGLDVARALARGADFVFLGRPFLYGTCAFDEAGPGIVTDILADELANALTLLGVERVEAIRHGTALEACSRDT